MASSLNTIAQTLLDQVRWNALRVDGSDASSVPAAVTTLASATTEEAADSAYWQLDNRVVVQGRVFDSALALVPILLALLAGELWYGVRARILDLLFEIQGGPAHEDEVARGSAHLGDACTVAVVEGRWLYYSALLDGHELVRRSAVDLFAETEVDEMRATEVLRSVAARDPSEEVRSRAQWWLDR